MRLLDRLVADVVQNATGYNVRGLVRRVGGRNILMVGGALLAGGAIAAESQRRATAPPPSSGSRPLPPPAPAVGLPPLPGSPEAAPPPSPPPPPGGGAVARGMEGTTAGSGATPTAMAEPVVSSEETALPNATLFSVVRTMVAAALADGELAAAEKALIERHLVAATDEEGGLSPEQVAQVRRDLVIPPSAKELAHALPEGEDQELLLRFAVLVIRADGAGSQHERAFLDTLAAALGVAPRRRAAIEAEIFP